MRPSSSAKMHPTLHMSIAVLRMFLSLLRQRVRMRAAVRRLERERAGVKRG